MLALRRQRLLRNWSLYEVARRTGLDVSTLSKIERGLLPVYPGWKRRLVRLFQVPADVLFARVDEEVDERGSICG